ncbi:MAG: bifunctional phosphoribosylaminoimidazolecarboxamide formyltransferase/IMP cyclohydrolase PurH, partial [Verrucomicrobiota bacterium]
SKDLRLLKLKSPMSTAGKGNAIRQINGGLLVQDRDIELQAKWDVPTRATFPDSYKALAEFGIKACKHVKSNAIILVRQYKEGSFSVLGMGAGQPNRVDAVRKLAITKARENIKIMQEADDSITEEQIMGECILISDAFFPFPDNIYNAAEAGIRYIVEPGGSKRDDDVIAACDEKGIAMALMGMRHFKH